MTALQSLRATNFWSLRPVTRMDLAVGAFEDISSAQVPGVPESLRAALPGLYEHRCSIGERGGFLSRLRRGTYAPHIIEHVALELQTMAGHDVGYGRTRGGDVPGEYTVIVEHMHTGVGLRAAALALEIVQRAFGRTLDPVEHAVAELRALADTPDVPAVYQHVLCGITGGGPRQETRSEMVRLGLPASALIVDVAPSYVLQAGLPYSRSEIAVILDAEPADVPPRYQDPERARRLVGVLCDAVWRNGIAVIPAKEWEVQDYAREQGCRVAVFATDDDVTSRDTKVARAVALVSSGRILLEGFDATEDGGTLRADTPATAQVAAALALYSLRELRSEGAPANVSIP